MKHIEQLLERLDTLHERGRGLLAHGPSSGIDVDLAEFNGWRTQVQSYLINLVGPDHIYYINFNQVTGSAYKFSVKSGLAIMRSLSEDLQKGFLTRVEDLVSAAVFGDFLDMASHLLDNGYKDAAASLIGAVLENGLRRVAVNNAIKVSSRDDLSALNNKCATNNVYTRSEQQQVQSWATLRNDADHGHFSKYLLEDVKRMLTDVRRILATYLV
ncbi:MAG TPA: hypothetical protein VN934_03655 [Candidatus Tumulicola sp.]|nr:hypothetical protein [Candidatus Tumulicola sp.]